MLSLKDEDLGPDEDRRRDRGRGMVRVSKGLCRRRAGLGLGVG